MGLGFRGSPLHIRDPARPERILCAIFCLEDNTNTLSVTSAHDAQTDYLRSVCTCSDASIIYDVFPI